MDLKKTSLSLASTTLTSSLRLKTVALKNEPVMKVWIGQLEKS